MSKRRTKIPTPTWEHEQTGIASKLDANRWQIWATAGILLLVFASLGIIGWAYLTDFVGDQQRPGSLGLRVAEQELTVSDYTKRAVLTTEALSTDNAAIIIPTVSQELIEEMILLQFADEQSVDATDEEVQEEVAATLGITADDPNYDARLQEELVRNGLTEEQFLGIARASILGQKVTAGFQAEIPDELPSINYRQIEVVDLETADALVIQVDEGAEFGPLAAEVSLNAASAEAGGEMGWFARGVLDENIEAVLFALEPGETTTFLGANSAFVFQVTETSEAREVSDADSIRLGQLAYADWLDVKVLEIEIKNEMDTTTGDPDKIRYVVIHANLTVN